MDKNDFRTLIKINGARNLGFNLERLKYSNSDLERSFSEEWQKENKKRPGINKGHGILQDHFIEDGLYRATFLCEITHKERLIVATIIQWLGTNCGRCFLERVLDKCGYRIVKKE